MRRRTFSFSLLYLFGLLLFSTTVFITFGFWAGSFLFYFIFIFIIIPLECFPLGALAFLSSALVIFMPSWFSRMLFINTLQEMDVFLGSFYHLNGQFIV